MISRWRFRSNDTRIYLDLSLRILEPDTVAYITAAGRNPDALSTARQAYLPRRKGMYNIQRFYHLEVHVRESNPPELHCSSQTEPNVVNSHVTTQSHRQLIIELFLAEQQRISLQMDEEENDR